MSRELEIVEAWQRVADRQQPFTAEDVTSEWKPEGYRAASATPEDSRLATVRRVLRTLEALEVIERHPNGNFQDPGWQRQNDRQVLLKDRRSDGSNEYASKRVQVPEGPPDAPPPPPGDDDQGDGGGGGEGFREVLSHPYLLTISQADFERLLGEI